MNRIGIQRLYSRDVKLKIT